MKNIPKKLGSFFTILFFTIAVLLMYSGRWMLNTWSHLTMEELIFHLKSPLDGTNRDLIFDYLISCLMPALLFGLILAILLFLFRKKALLHRISYITALIAAPLMIGLTAYQVWGKLDMGTYVKSNKTYSTFIDEHYVNPSDVTLTFPEEKRNLIHIYLESMETTYSDTKNGGAFTENVIPELTKLSHTYEDFSGTDTTLNGGISLYGSTWTMGALFAQTSGLPLSLPIDGNAMSGQSTFLPNLTTEGDILANAGYNQAFLIGSDATFGGRKLYFTEHGNYQIWDYNYFIEQGDIPEDYYVFWGFEDNYLIEFAKEKLTWLSQQEEPFNLTMLTVDTHFEDGYLCSDCEMYYEDDQYANVMRCSSKKVAELISWIQEQDFYDNTTIVLTGDHPTMDSDFCNNVPDDYQRKVITTYINAPIRTESQVYRTYSTFDIFPTTIASLGIKIEGDRLGLGTNLFSDTATLCEDYDNTYVNSEIQKKSKLMETLTSDIKYASGNVTVGDYDFITDSFNIFVDEIEHSVDIVDMRCLVWTMEERSDAKWYVLEYNEDAPHFFDIPTGDFSSDVSTYYAEVYIYTDDAMMYQLGTVTFEK